MKELYNKLFDAQLGYHVKPNQISTCKVYEKQYEENTLLKVGNEKNRNRGQKNSKQGKGDKLITHIKKAYTQE
ncbi:unnamed protein product [Cunninghamella blakesleeana]